MRLLRVLAILLVLGLVGLAGYAYFGDMAADPVEVRVPLKLDLGATAPSPPEEAAAPEAAPADTTDTGDGAANGLD